MLRPRHAPDTRRARVQKTGTGSTIEKRYSNKKQGQCFSLLQEVGPVEVASSQNATVEESPEAGQNLAIVIMSTPLANAPPTTRRQKPTGKTLEKVQQRLLDHVEELKMAGRNSKKTNPNQIGQLS